MYYINKIVGWCLSPLGMFFAALVLSVLLQGKGLRRSGRAIGAVACLALWFLSCGVSARWIGYPLEGEEIDVATLPHADAIVLLGGGMAVHETCGRPELCFGADRAWTAARLFKLGKAPVVTVSGGAAQAEIAFLADMGVDTNKIVRLDAARNTAEEASLIARAIKAVQGAAQGETKAKILLVTSAWHMPRAKMLFERAGFSVVPAPTDYEFHAMVETPCGVGDFFPCADVLDRNACAVKEWVARACYWVKR